MNNIFQFPPLLILLIIGIFNNAQAYEDHTHYSKVFGEDRTYRIFFPGNYEQSNKDFPVIYLFHGWGGRYFKDPSANFHFEKMDSLVQNNEVIMVMWDGNIDPDQPRPYNIGLEQHMKYEVQFKDYFLELVNHVDTTYKTQTGRTNRALMGFSMGGFMSYFLAGKYPDMVCAAVNFVGSPEFYIGYPENHTLYSIRHTFQNLYGIRLRFQNSESGEISYLNREVINAAKREANLDFEYEYFKGGHRLDRPGHYKNFKKSFHFILSVLEYPLPKPEKWHHLDLYKSFEVWNYKVNSNKSEPGYICLQDVTKNGFTVQTQKWLPEGPPISSVKISLKTAPVYGSHQKYTITDFTPVKNKIKTYTKRSDGEGRLTFNFDHQKHLISINRYSQETDFVVAGYKTGNTTGNFIQSSKPSRVALQIFNRGKDIEEPIYLKLSSPDDLTLIQPNEIKIPPVHSGDTVWTEDFFEISTYEQQPGDGRPHQLRLHLNQKYVMNEKYTHQLDIPVFYNVRPFSNITIDDGIARDSTGVILGKGNGNGIPEPGEEIMVYVDDHRTKFFTQDDCIKDKNEKANIEVLPSSWSDGFTVNSILKIGKDCPEGKTIDLVGYYETKGYEMNRRFRHWGKFQLKVQ